MILNNSEVYALFCAQLNNITTKCFPSGEFIWNVWLSTYKGCVYSLFRHNKHPRVILRCMGDLALGCACCSPQSAILFRGNNYNYRAWRLHHNVCRSKYRIYISQAAHERYKNSRVEEGPSCMNSVWCSLLKYADGLSVNKLYLFWDTEKKNVLDLHHDEKNPLHSRGAGGRVEVAAGGRAGGVLLRHETEAYVTVIFVINIHNGNILWEDFYHKWVQTAVRPSQWSDRGALSQRETVLMNNLILKVIVNGKQSCFVEIYF